VQVGNGNDGTIGWIREIVLNSSDPQSLATFLASLLGGKPVEWYPGWITPEPPPHGQRLSFQGAGAEAGSAAGSEAGTLSSSSAVRRNHLEKLILDSSALPLLRMAVVPGRLLRQGSVPSACSIRPPAVACVGPVALSHPCIRSEHDHLMPR